MMALLIAALSCSAWVYLVVGRGGFWRAAEHDNATLEPPRHFDRWPRVVAVVPARNEADVIGENVGSLLRQNYPGTLSIVVVNGAMRFVSGVSSRNSYEIKTPLANIGVRGTVVDILQEGNRTIVNFVDGSGSACIVATGACHNIGLGEGALAIRSNGFSPATAAEAGRLWRRLDSAHLALARQIGHDPSAATGAAVSTTGSISGRRSSPNSRPTSALTGARSRPWSTPDRSP